MKIRSSLPVLGLLVMTGCGSASGAGAPVSDGTATTTEAEQFSFGGRRADVRHVVLIGVDGLHTTDAAHWIAAHPDSTLAELAEDGVDRTPFPPGSARQGNPGTEATYFEILEKDFTQLFSPIDPGNLPLAKDRRGNCNPVFPHDFIKVNTVFEVIRAAGGYTAWSDKHPAYDLVNGPSGKGIDDLDPAALEAVRKENTQPLPGLRL